MSFISCRERKRPVSCSRSGKEICILRLFTELDSGCDGSCEEGQPKINTNGQDVIRWQYDAVSLLVEFQLKVAKSAHLLVDFVAGMK